MSNVLITGCSSGIGLATALEIGAGGASCGCYDAESGAQAAIGGYCGGGEIAGGDPGDGCGLG